ncbi:DMT family transporter [Rhodococcus sp. IEGM1300]
MATAQTNIIIGVMLAGVATLSWALNFIAPYVTGNYSLYDLMLVKFLIAGGMGVAVVVLCRNQLRLVRHQQRMLAAGLGVLGYLGYSVCIAAGVIFGGPVLTAAFIGMVPVLLALLGNATNKTILWRSLALPLTLMTAGLLLSNIGSLNQPTTSNNSWLLAVAFSVSAVALWLAFSVINQRALEKLPANATGIWTGLMMVGAGLGTVCLLPIVWGLGLLELPILGTGISQAGPLYLWSLLIAVMSSLVGAWAWNAASRRLPMVLSGQLISLESLFATLLGLMFHGRLPTGLETTGLGAVLLGVGMAVHAVHRQSKTSARCDKPVTHPSA